MDIYTSSTLPYPLNKSEIECIESVWQFIEQFLIGHINISEYRGKIINKIQNKYNIDEFEKLEIIAEKIFWNLRDRLKDEDKERAQIKIFNLNILQNMDDINDLLKEDNYYRSHINKIINIDLNKEKLYYKKMEGLAPIFNKNIYNTLIFNIFFDRNIYEEIMEDIENINILNMDRSNTQMDYGFPNMNTCFPFIYSDGYRTKRIYKMYYEEHCHQNWIELIKN